jgi:hypothetical protein
MPSSRAENVACAEETAGLRDSLALFSLGRDQNSSRTYAFLA